MSADRIDGKAFAAGLRERLAAAVPPFQAKTGRVPGLAVVLVGLGATSLSMAPTALAGVRATLLQYTAEDAHAIAEAALEASDAAGARAAAQEVAAARS